MAKIGIMNKLQVVKRLNYGVYLDGEGLGNILLPNDEVEENCKIGDLLDVFIMHDSQKRLVATTAKPKAMVGECAYLKVASVTEYGAFLDWGAPRNIIVHTSEQKQRMEKGKSYTIFVYLSLEDKGKRIAASSKLDKFIDRTPHDFGQGQEVDLLICEQNDLGYKAIINNSHWGMLYKNEVFQDLKVGSKIKGFINKLRSDQKIDLCLQKPGPQKVGDFSDIILKKIHEQGGVLAVSDKSSPKIIYEMFGVSKKTFKKAIGVLYKRRMIVIGKNDISLAGQLNKSKRQ